LLKEFVLKKLSHFFPVLIFILVVSSCSFSGNEGLSLPDEEDMFEEIKVDNEEKDDFSNSEDSQQHNDSDDYDDEKNDNNITEPDDNNIPDPDVENNDNEADDNEVPDQEDVVDKVIVATYNTEFFYDTICDTGYCGYGEFEPQLTPAEYNAKVKDVADALKLINADIVLLQEVEKQSCLDDLLDELDGMYDTAYIGEKGGAGSMNTAVITKGKVTSTNKHLSPIPLPYGGTTTFARAFFEVRITYEGKKIIVFSAHFKSKSNDDPERRQAEANAALEILKDTAYYNSDALIVLGGDLNDVPGSGPINTLENSSSLLRVASELPVTDQATYWYQGPTAIDHIFHVLDGKGEYISGTAEVIKNGPETYRLMDSDHAALRAAFSF
jgi:uncharacterized protein